MKKVIISVIFIVAVLSLTSCRSKKNSCDYGKVTISIEMDGNSQEELVACID
jgi:hypothetical protein